MNKIFGISSYSKMQAFCLLGFNSAGICRGKSVTWENDVNNINILSVEKIKEKLFQGTSSPILGQGLRLKTDEKVRKGTVLSYRNEEHLGEYASMTRSPIEFFQSSRSTCFDLHLQRNKNLETSKKLNFEKSNRLFRCHISRVGIRHFCTSSKLLLEQNDLVKESTTLKIEDLNNLLLGKTLAIRISNFFSRSLCKTIENKIFETDYSFYSYAPDSVGRLGLSFSEIKNSEKLGEYYDHSIKNIKNIRKIFSPYQSPSDKLRLILEEIWPEGAMLAKFHRNKKSYVGLCRVIEAEKDVLPHQDVLSWDCETIPDLKELPTIIKEQLAANTYLSVPELGGELELWDYGIRSKEEYDYLAKGTYGLDKKSLPPPKVRIRPEKGDLILFKPTNLHCISKGNQRRLTSSLFIGYAGKNHPLIYWS